MIFTIPILVISIFIGLYLPDIDIKLMAILHHRSMLTHSVVIPMLMMLHRPLRPFAGGLCVGISIHLLADMLSPMRGFALIYIPLIKKSIGDWQSIAWMLGNALFGLWLAVRMFHKYAVALMFGVFGLWYALYNEQTIMTFVPCALILVLAGVYDRKASLRSHVQKASLK